jgi:hypothetical protein
VKQNPRISAAKIAAELKNDLDVNVCTGTVSNFLRSRGFHGRLARRKYFVSEEKVRIRENVYIHLNRILQRVIFTDESKFNIFGSDGHCTVWRKTNTEHKKEICVVR